MIIIYSVCIADVNMTIITYISLNIMFNYECIKFRYKL